ncbi:MAG: hypothetical protein V1822_01330 [Candidatus Micrarchaeota archaeon]
MGCCGGNSGKGNPKGGSQESSHGSAATGCGAGKNGLNWVQVVAIGFILLFIAQIILRF